jgi:hypothetical protein
MATRRDQIIAKLCGIVGMVQRSIGDYSHASDCFCVETPNFQHEEKTIDYVREAVIEKLKRDGYTVVT